MPSAKAPFAPTPSLALETITQRIFVLREQKVLLDADLAALYGVDTRRLNEQVRRNRDRFLQDFIFELTRDELNNLMSQFATSSFGEGQQASRVKRGPAPKWQQQIEAVAKLPRAQQRFVSQMLDTVLAGGVAA
jgi:hypothetical protein